MGYKKPYIKAIKRIQDVINDECLGLNFGRYDFKYNDMEFLYALCRTVNIDISNHINEIREIQSELYDRRPQWKPFIFVDTGFIRKSQPIFILAFLESSRNIYLEFETTKLTLPEQIETVKSIIKEHYTKNNKELYMWGEIQQYRFCYQEGKAIIMSPDGDVLSETDNPKINEAKISIGNKNIKKIFDKESD